MKEMEKKRNRLILLMLLLPLVVSLIATGCKKKRDDLYQFVITSATTSDSSSEDTAVPSESESETVTETESEATTETETEPTEETTESETEAPTPTPTRKPTRKPTAKPTRKPTPKITIKSKKTTKKIYVKPKYTDYLFVGDSRTVGLDDCVSGISSKAKVGAKVDYLKSILKDVTKTRKKNVIFNFGVNDLGNINKYIKVYKSLPKDFIKNNNVIIMSVNPTDGSKYNSWNKDINSFNSKMKKNLPSGVKYMDTNSQLKKTGFSTRDGVHYTTDTYKKIARLTFDFCGDYNRKP